MADLPFYMGICARWKEAGNDRRNGGDSGRDVLVDGGGADGGVPAHRDAVERLCGEGAGAEVSGDDGFGEWKAGGVRRAALHTADGVVGGDPEGGSDFSAVDRAEPERHCGAERGGGSVVAPVEQAGSTGVGLVAATGLLDGKRATTHWGVAPEFRRQFPKVKWMPEVMVTEDRGFYCGGGVNASLDLSLYLVERYCGHEVAMQTAKALLIETPRAWQAGFGIVPLKTEHSDEAISGAQEWLHKNFQRNFALEAPARAVGMSMRNFVRRFKEATGDTPLIYLQKLRVAVAKRLLESDHRGVQEVSEAVGYQDVAFFRTIFERHTGAAPSAYRRRFGQVA